MNGQMTPQYWNWLAMKASGIRAQRRARGRGQLDLVDGGRRRMNLGWWCERRNREGTNPHDGNTGNDGRANVRMHNAPYCVVIRNTLISTVTTVEKFESGTGFAWDGVTERASFGYGHREAQGGEAPVSTPTADRPLRVIQWTTGNIGRRSLHAIIGRGDMELVGVYAHGADKVGVDAAELAGWPEPTGVNATNDIDALLALKPDACCYNPLWPNIDELARLLESGVNVCSSAAWITGGKQTPEDLERIRKACEKGNSTIFGSGAHPGMTNMVGMVLSGSCERVDEIRITESVDWWSGWIPPGTPRCRA